MLRKLRERAQNEQGFTLIELLVVILIIGILAAIAIPSFINQRSKGQDAAAKSVVVTASEAIETYATDNNGNYTGVTVPLIQQIEPSLNDTPLPVIPSTVANADAAVTAANYSVMATSSSTVTFGMQKVAGVTARRCSVPAGVSRGGCNSADSW